MSQLAIDMGNTRVKAGVFSGEELIKTLENIDLKEVLSIITQEGIESIIVSSVISGFKEFQQLVTPQQVLRLTPDLEIPIKNRYATPNTLGMDRLAGVIGAHQLYGESDCLVIDAGTTITYDFVDKQGNYLGGGISPGLGVRLASLNQHTSQLPLIPLDSMDIPLIGIDTRSSILSGVVNGTTAEIEGIIRRYAHKFPTLKVILCGGDAGIFESKLDASVTVISHLVLIGLNSVLMYHAQSK